MERHHSAGNREFNPETLALGYAYNPWLSEGALKPPVFLTSTFQFRSAEEGKRYFELAYGLRDRKPGEALGLIYSRLNNPNLEIFERRMAAWDRTEKGALFSSGMAAIATTMLSMLGPGDEVIATTPLYGGTHYLLSQVLPRFGIVVTRVAAGNDTADRVRELASDKTRLIFVETPANPSNTMIDIEAVSRVAAELSSRGKHVYVVVDNTFLGPVFQRPASFGADLVIYSATKFIGGHSDVIAGLVTGTEALIDPILLMRTILGTMATPFSGWLLLRSLETVSIRMRRQAKSAVALAKLLVEHPRVVRVHHPSVLRQSDPQRAIFEKQCTGPGSLIAFEIDGHEEDAFRVLNRFEVARLAVSLGSTETLVEHPRSMTHADVAPEELERVGVSDAMIRMSVGLEHLSDLKRDLLHALATD